MFYRIDGEPVYMHDDLYDFVKEQCLNKGTLTNDDFKGLFVTPEQSVRKEKAMKEYLSELAKENGDMLSKLCFFEFEDDECESNIWELLHDYTLLHRSYYLGDVRSGMQQIIGDMMGETSYHLPMGKKFLLVHGTQRNKATHWFFRSHSTSVEICVNDVIAIEGNLNHLQIRFKSGSILDLNMEHMTIQLSSYMPLDPHSSTVPNC